MRKDAKIKQFESFTYDNLDRLLTFHRGTTTSAGDAVTHTRNMSYDNTGNITSYNQLGNYDYNGYGPHAVSMVSLHEAAPMGILASQCDVNYNAFNKPTLITEGDYQLNLFYGADGIRHKSILQQSGNTVKTTCFVGDLYEKETVDGVTRHLNYIYAGDTIPKNRIKIAFKTSYPCYK
jgi:hypothetical protein